MATLVAHVWEWYRAEKYADLGAEAVVCVVEHFPTEMHLQAIRLVIPSAEPGNQDFWFEWLCCEFESDSGFESELTVSHYFDNNSDRIDGTVRHAVALDLPPLTQFCKRVVYEEETVKAFIEDEDEGGSFQFILAILRGWTAAHAFPSGCSSEDQAAFLKLLSELPEGAKQELGRDGLGWVGTCF